MGTDPIRNQVGSWWDAFGPDLPETPWSKVDSIDTQTPDASKYGYADDAYKQRLQQGQAAADARQAPYLDWTQAQAARAQQQALANQYEAQIQGKTPSLAEQQLRAGQAANTAQASALAAGARGGGGNAILAQRQAQQQAALGGLAVNRDAGMQRVQEQQAAMANQSALLGQMRGADQGQVQLGAASQLHQTQLNDQRNAAYLGAEQHYYDQGQKGGIAYDQSRTGIAQSTDQFNAGLAEEAKKRQAGTIDKAFGGLGGVFGLAAL